MKEIVTRTIEYDQFGRAVREITVTEQTAVIDDQFIAKVVEKIARAERLRTVKGRLA